MIRAVVFDLDGTLIDSHRDIAAAVNATLADLGRPERDPEEIKHMIGDGVVMLLGRALATDDPAQIEAARRTFAGHYRGALLDTTRLFPGVAEMLRRLAPLPLAVATNKPAAFTAPIAEGLELARHGIRACACADEAGARKPDPRVLRLALERAGAATILPAEVLMVGDMPVDVATARGHGAKAAVVTWGFTARGGLEAARPDVIVDRPEDLAAWVEIENRDDQNPKTWGG